MITNTFIFLPPKGFIFFRIFAPVLIHCLSLHRSDSDHAYDILCAASARQVVDRSGDALGERSVCLLPCRVSVPACTRYSPHPDPGRSARSHVLRLRCPAPWKRPLRNDRRVELKFSVKFQLRSKFMGKACRLNHLVYIRVFCTALWWSVRALPRSALFLSGS